MEDQKLLPHFRMIKVGILIGLMEKKIVFSDGQEGIVSNITYVGIDCTNSEILEVTIGNKKQNIFYPSCGENVYKFENIHSQQMMQEDIKNYPEVEELYQAWINGLV